MKKNKWIPWEQELCPLAMKNKLSEGKQKVTETLSIMFEVGCFLGLPCVKSLKRNYCLISQTYFEQKQ